ncbi:hypothetical protein ILYODFUR_009003 [Ilyodon furcidens]|uniref:Uncharacterized protein n=1 Tax=Ilyodon furcidens TaxID=33524 RepID=A0ABV0SVE4_9TELE
MLSQRLAGMSSQLEFVKVLSGRAYRGADCLRQMPANSYSLSEELRVFALRLSGKLTTLSFCSPNPHSSNKLPWIHWMDYSTTPFSHLPVHPPMLHHLHLSLGERTRGLPISTTHHNLPISDPVDILSSSLETSPPLQHVILELPLNLEETLSYLRVSIRCLNLKQKKSKSSVNSFAV